MSADEGGGGTSLRNRKMGNGGGGPPQGGNGMDPRMAMGQPPQGGNGMDPRMEMGPPPQGGGMDPRMRQPPQGGGMDPRIMPPEQQQMIAQQLASQHQRAESVFAKNPFTNKSSFGKYVNTSTMKTSVIVSFIFLLMNSKIIWKQILKIPMMGTIEPSILALVVNSLLAGIFFYVINLCIQK
jgi:hypothetical protein